MALLSMSSVAIASAAYTANPQADLGFKPDWWRFHVGSVSSADDMIVSFDGVNDHLYLAAGSPIALGSDAVSNKSQRAWIRRAGGIASVNVHPMAGTLA